MIWGRKIVFSKDVSHELPVLGILKEITST